MTRRAEILVTGHPVAKGRGRAVNTPNGPRIYTPGKTAKWEQDARLVARQVMDGEDPIPGPVSVYVTATFVPANSWPKWKRAAALAGDIRHTQKPDVDNLAKAAMDAINGVVFVDDQQVFRVVIEKHYGTVPAVSIEVEQVEQPDHKDEWNG